MVKKNVYSTSFFNTGHPSISIFTTGHNITSNMSVIQKDVSKLKEDILFLKEKNEELVLCIEELKKGNNGTFIPIEEDDLNFIYDNLIKPYIDCEYHLMAGIIDVIRINNILSNLIKNTNNSKNKIILNIFKDIMTVLINARNDKTSIDVINTNLSFIKTKYKECTKEVIKLKKKLEFLTKDKPYAFGVFDGEISIKVKKLKPTIYMQARFDIDRAWYLYLYGNCLIDPEKYQSTILYVRSFGTLQNAYCKLIELLDEKYNTFEDDLTNEKDKIESQEIEEIEESREIE